MSLTNTTNDEINTSEVSEVIRLKLSGEDYLRFNQMIPNIVLGKKMSDTNKKGNVSILAIKCFTKVMDVVTSGGRNFVQADPDGILSTFIKKSSNDEAYAKLVKAITAFKVNDDGSVTISAKQHEDLLAIANITYHNPNKA